MFFGFFFNNVGDIENFFLFFRFYFFIFREKKGGRKRGKEISVCGCLSRDPHWAPSQQPRHVP